MQILLINAPTWVQFLFRSMVGVELIITVLRWCFWKWWPIVDIFMMQINLHAMSIKILQVSILLKIVFMFLTVKHCPGYLPMNTENEENKKLIDEGSHRQLAGVVCKECCSRRPLRTFHCSACDRCIFRYDHHSYLLNTCIGYGNQVYYFGYLLSSLVMDYTCFYIFVRHVSSLLALSLWQWFCAACVVFLCFSLCKSEVLNTLFTISLAKPFSDNVFQNLTAYEADHYHRIGYLKYFVLRSHFK